MFAVGADEPFCKAYGLIVTRPAECGLEHDLFRRIALRLVEERRRLWLAEDIRHTVVADAIAGTEVRVRVVVEGAPADAAGVLRIGCQRVVHARVPDGVLTQSFHAVEGFAWIRMPDELGIEVARMVRLLQRPA